MTQIRERIATGNHAYDATDQFRQMRGEQRRKKNRQRNGFRQYLWAVAHPDVRKWSDVLAESRAADARSRKRKAARERKLDRIISEAK